MPAGFDDDAITVVRDIGGATEVLARLTRAGDVILFENDLPDMYAEDNEPRRRRAGSRLTRLYTAAPCHVRDFA